MDLAALIEKRGVSGLRTEAGALRRLEKLEINHEPAITQLLHTVVRLPSSGRFVVVVFLRAEQMHLAHPLAIRGVFVMGGGICG